LLSGKAHITHRKDIRSGLIKLLCRTREEEDRPELLVARGLGITNLTDIILSRQRLPYLDALCEAKGVAGEPVIFQTKDDKSKKRASILGEGTNDRERALYWILGEMSSPLLSSCALIP
jgi:hypothetical protein